jgi:hypothetical protein
MYTSFNRHRYGSCSFLSFFCSSAQINNRYYTHTHTLFLSFFSLYSARPCCFGVCLSFSRDIPAVMAVPRRIGEGNQKERKPPLNSIQIAVACELVSSQSGANSFFFIPRLAKNNLIKGEKSCFTRKFFFFPPFVYSYNIFF